MIYIDCDSLVRVQLESKSFADDTKLYFAHGDCDTTAFQTVYLICVPGLLDGNYKLHLANAMLFSEILA